MRQDPVGGPADRILRELLRAARAEARKILREAWHILAELGVAWWERMRGPC